MSLADFNRAMADEGFFVLPGALPMGVVEELRDGLERGVEICAMAMRNAGISGAEGVAHHLPAVVGEPFLSYLENTPANEYIAPFFGGPCILNSMGGQLNVGHTYASEIHRDIRSYWRDRMMLNTIVALDDFTADNGATWVMRAGKWWEEKPSEDEFEAGAVQLVMPAGSIAFWDSRTWHRAGANRASVKRRILTPLYARSFYRQEFDYVRAIGTERVGAMSSPLQQILGMFARTPARIADYYRPKEQRFYRPGQG